VEGLAAAFLGAEPVGIVLVELCLKSMAAPERADRVGLLDACHDPGILLVVMAPLVLHPICGVASGTLLGNFETIVLLWVSTSLSLVLDRNLLELFW
jgi:hypothetical protein